VTLARVAWSDPRAVALRDEMDAEMTLLYADLAAKARPDVTERMEEVLLLDPDDVVATVLAFDGERAVGHAVLRPYEGSLEVKRVIVAATHRGRGIARILMTELETIARQDGVNSIVLHTGVLQVPAIRMYEALGYRPIPYFRGYEAVTDSVCFEKLLPFG